MQIGLTLDEYVDLKVKPSAGADRAFHRAAEAERAEMFPMTLTAREIEDRIGIKAHKRLPELREAGLIRNGPARTCRVSERQALTWDPDAASRHESSDHLPPSEQKAGPSSERGPPGSAGGAVRRGADDR